MIDQRLLGVAVTAALLPVFMLAQTRSMDIRIGGFATARSELIEMAAQERLEVKVDGTAADIFVHSDSKELLARDNPESADVAFEFTAPRPGRYYVLLRNTSGTAGVAHVSVLPSSATGRDVIRVAEKARIRLFYSTDRQKVLPGQNSAYFGPEPAPGNQMSYGTVEVSIPRSHDMGELEGPSIWRLEFKPDPERHIVVVGETLKNMDRRAFLNAVEEKVSTTEKREALVFVHGFNVSFEDAARRAAQISYDLGFKGATVLYSWPSQGSLGLQAYLKDGENAQISARSLQALLEDLRDHTGATSIHVIAHSMGNRLLTAALARIAEKRPTMPSFRQIALLAPDVSVPMFRSLAAVFPTAAERVTLYASSRDEALVASRKLQGYARAGEGGPNIIVVPRVDSIDASGVNTSALGLFHEYYGDSRTILSDLFYLFEGQPPDQRHGLTKATQRGFWFFRH